MTDSVQDSWIRPLVDPAYLGAGVAREIPAREPITVINTETQPLREIGFKMHMVLPERYEIREDGFLWGVFPDGREYVACHKPEILQKLNFQ